MNLSMRTKTTMREKMANKNLVWNTYREDFNSRRIVEFNVFDHYMFYDECRKAAMTYRDNFELFQNEIRKSLVYYFRWKCEHEIIISDWPPSDNFQGRKVSVYDQVMMNWEHFIKYLWEQRKILIW